MTITRTNMTRTKITRTKITQTKTKSGTKRPFIFINTAMTADGKISTIGRRQVKISNDLDMERVDKLRAGSDAVLVGAKTAVGDDPKLTVKSEKLRKERIKHGLPENPIKVTLGSVSINDLEVNSDFMSHGNSEKIIFATKKNKSRQNP